MLLKVGAILMLLVFQSAGNANAQLGLADIIAGAIKKVVKAADLKIQRQQNKVIWLQNAQKTLENNMAKLRLKEISDWTQKQRDLYSGYYDELKKVRAVISYYQRIKQVTTVQLGIVREYKRGMKSFTLDNNFSASELEHISKVYSGVLSESLKHLDQLNMVANSFRTQMTDAQRLELIEDAAVKMEAIYRDIVRFNRQNVQVSFSRAREKGDMETVSKLYGIK